MKQFPDHVLSQLIIFFQSVIDVNPIYLFHFFFVINYFLTAFSKELQRYKIIIIFPPYHFHSSHEKIEYHLYQRARHTFA